jgi:hypothetical protein
MFDGDIGGATEATNRVVSDFKALKDKMRSSFASRSPVVRRHKGCKRHLGSILQVCQAGFKTTPNVEWVIDSALQALARQQRPHIFRRAS